ncbi:hypothetical protein SAMN05518672_101723 [Chitinophaga sp. CF118]|nr:hypothetical protein SAMN05518672_101723 [Chitinophaga sp. CF118]
MANPKSGDGNNPDKIKQASRLKRNACSYIQEDHLIAIQALLPGSPGSFSVLPGSGHLLLHPHYGGRSSELTS